MMAIAASAASRRLFLVQTVQQQSLQSLHIAICYASQQNPVRNRHFGLEQCNAQQQRSFSSREPRRRMRQKRRRMRDETATELKKEHVDQSRRPVKPWWRYISIWPDPHGYDPEFERQQRFPRPTSVQQLREAWALSMKEYRWSHEGWLLPVSEETDATGGTKETSLSVSDQVEAQRKQIQSNVAKNVKFLEVEGTEALEQVQKKTGIYTLADLKAWTALQLQLATECVQEFMAGYREGRDDEVEKMMNQYFQGMWEDEEPEASDEEPKKKRRKPKRRVRTTE